MPYTFVIPQPLFDEELLSLTEEDKAALVAAGLEVLTLPGEQVQRASVYFNQNRRLKLNDCFALVIAQDIEDAILFTGDAPLRALADDMEIETHGVLWAIDQLAENTNIPHHLLHDALIKFANDPLVFLPPAEVKWRIKRYQNRRKRD